MIKNKNIALIAHDARKADMIEWVKYNAKTLMKNSIVCTGTTGDLVEKKLKECVDCSDGSGETQKPTQVKVMKMKSGPMGGDAQIAAMVVDGRIDFCVFLIDDMSPNPHEADIQMLLRQCRLHNVPVACNRSSADHIISSDLWGTDYEPTESKYTRFNRKNLNYDGNGDSRNDPH